MEATNTTPALQFLTDEDGQQTAVVIPISDWKLIEDTYYKRVRFLEEVKESFAELNQIKRGESTLRPIEDLWDELPD